MSPRDRCDEVIRLIDEALDETLVDAAVTAARDPDGSGSSPERPEPKGVEELPGHWGVYYLRPTA